MPDATLQSLSTILNSAEYECTRGVPLFDEHDEYDSKGQLVRRFDKQYLTELADKLNAQVKETGDLVPFGPGHTVDDVWERDEERKPVKLLYKAKETDQPPIFGYFGNFRIGTFGPKKKVCLLADKYVKKEHAQEAATYPRRSVELWAERKELDWVALLRRAPQRNLGLLIYGKSFDKSYNHDRLYYDKSRRLSLAAYDSPDGKLRYSMEAHMADAMEREEHVPPSEQEHIEHDTEHPHHEEAPEGVPSDVHEHFMKCVKHHFPHLADMHKKYIDTLETQGGMGGDVLEQPIKAGKAEKAKRDAENDKRLAALEMENRRLKYSKYVAKTNAKEGIELDEEEIMDVAADFEPERFQKHVAMLVKYAKAAKAPTHEGWIDGLRDSPVKKPKDFETGDIDLDRPLLEEALKYQKKHNCTWEEAEEHVLAGKK
jgi:hypothetical protein